ncbi:MAG: hypothetical protein ACE5H0_06095 [Bacteroidota bacterium]
MARAKRIEYYCSYCNRSTKMEVVGEMEGVPDKSWYRCPKCRHSMLVSLEALRKEPPGQENKIQMRDCTQYSPEKIYEVGQKIVHHEWNDVGKVITKEITSSGAQAIIVAFEKLGERRLIENLNAVEEPPQAPTGPQPAGITNAETTNQRSDLRSEGTTSTTKPVGGDKSW